ncbi:hypothetical protein RF11_03709 [Thelohanellus kitauei]|uniref:Uncharacterized protein n=1 Tax=Thelohanellus kitauei TaxID=669202 RepID=A0A0C2N4N0_THEKT|nr:hypothetical protein RF11_03709 [Thelohanellus kitauei]
MIRKVGCRIFKTSEMEPSNPHMNKETSFQTSCARLFLHLRNSSIERIFRQSSFETGGAFILRRGLRFMQYIGKPLFMDMNTILSHSFIKYTLRSKKVSFSGDFEDSYKLQ